MLNDEIHLKLMGPENFEVKFIDKTDLKAINEQVNGVPLHEIHNPAVFTFETSTIFFINENIKRFYGEHISERVPIEVTLYPLGLLKSVCRDGIMYSKHVEWELKLLNFLTSSSDKFFKNYAIYYKKVGAEMSDRDLYVLNEKIDPNKYISLKDLIKTNGGLARTPFLLQSGAIVYVLKLWCEQILSIINLLHSHGVVATILRPENIYVSKDGTDIKVHNLRGAAKINEDGKITFVSDYHLNLQNFNVDQNSGISTIPTSHSTQKIPPHVISDPFMAPEMLIKKPLDCTFYIDTWAFGNLLFFILFGEYPPSLFEVILKEGKIQNLENFGSPSSFMLFDIFSTKLVTNIYKEDYGIANSLKDTSTSVLEKVFDKKTYCACLYDLMGDPLNSDDWKESLKKIVDLIPICLDFDPARRPTTEQIAKAKLFTLDKFEINQAKEFARVCLLYKSPSRSIKEEINIPMAAIFKRIFKKEQSAYLYYQEFLHLAQSFHNVLQIPAPNKTFIKNLKRELISKENSTSYDEITSKINSGLEVAYKHPNASLIKNMFENFLLDKLIFCGLRIHKSMVQRKEKNSDQVLVIIKKIFIELFTSLKSYDMPTAPYVGSILDNFVKVCIGEEYSLASNLIDPLDDLCYIAIRENSLSEYENQKCKYSFVFPGENDAIFAMEWSKHIISKPYIQHSQLWTSHIYQLFSPLFKDYITESGRGNIEIKVLSDYLRFLTEKGRIPQFEVELRIERINKLILNKIPKGADYYGEIGYLMEIMNNLSDTNEQHVPTVRLSLGHIKTVILGRKVEKIKALLDSRLIMFILKWINHEDVHLRKEIYEILVELSLSFKNEMTSFYVNQDIIGSKFNPILDTRLRTVEELEKYYGVLTFITQTNEDKYNQDLFIKCSNNYYNLNGVLITKFLRQMGMIFKNCIVTSSLVTVLKTKADLIANKILCLQILKNILDAPYCIITSLNHSAIDLWATLSRLTVTHTKGNDLKQNEILQNYAIDLFKKIVRDCRPELVTKISRLSHVTTLLRSQDIYMPRPLTTYNVSQKVEEMRIYFESKTSEFEIEINNALTKSLFNATNSTKGSKQEKNINVSPSTSTLSHFENLLDDAVLTLFSYIVYYPGFDPSYSSPDVSLIIIEMIRILKGVFSALIDYANLSPTVSFILIKISNFFEALSLFGFESLILYCHDDAKNQSFASTTQKNRSSLTRKLDMELGKANLTWMMECIMKIYNYHDLVERTMSASEPAFEKQLKLFLRDLLKNDAQTSNDFSKEKSILKFFGNNELLRKYSTNKMYQAAHSFLRIITRAVESNTFEYNTLLEQCKFSLFFVRLVKKQHRLMNLFMKTKTENLNLITKYVEEVNIRVRMFEYLMRSSSSILKEELVNTSFVSFVVGQLLKNTNIFDVKFYRTNFKFISFRDYQPFRNEALAYIQSIIWNKESSLNERIYTEFVIEIAKFGIIDKERRFIESQLSNKSKNLITLASSIHLIKILEQAHDHQLNFLLKQEEIFEIISECIDAFPALKKIANIN